MAKTQKTNPFKQHYDKIIVAVVMLALIGSLAVLIHRAATQKDKDAAFMNQINALKPQFAEAGKVSDAVFNATMDAMENPAVITTNSSFVVAPVYVSCVSCAWPIKYEADICPVCSAPQPKDTRVADDWDSDEDGMPDNWETKYGLNPYDPGDADKDLDNDGFTNLEEFKAGTDPADPKSRPPLIDFLRVSSIEAIRFPYTVTGKTRNPGTNVTYRFQVNDIARNMMQMVREGDKLGETGYTLESYSFRKVIEQRPGMAPREVERAVLKLKSPSNEITLVEGDLQPVWHDYNVTFYCTKDKDNVSYGAKRGETFDFDGAAYSIVSINKEKETVVIRQGTTGDTLQVSKDESIKINNNK